MSLGQVFVSHSSQDKAFVEKLVADLTAHAIPVWYDKLDLGVGESVPGRINDGLTKSRYFLIVLSPAALASAWVREELNAGLMKQVTLGGTFVIPVLYKDCEVPPLLAHRRYADFRSDYTMGLSDLLAVWGKDTQACSATGRSEVFPWPDPEQADIEFVYLHSTRFDKFFRVGCSLTWTANAMLDYLIASRSLPYHMEQPELGMKWRFSYRLVFNKKVVRLSTKLIDAGIALGSVLQLSINGTYEDVFQKELKSMWDGSKMYDVMEAMRREQQLKAAIAARGPLTKERLREFSNRCFSHV
jgi:hypothetical protein